LFVLFKLDAGILEQVDRVFGVHVLRQIKFEVKLPGGGARFRELALVVEKGESQLASILSNLFLSLMVLHQKRVLFYPGNPFRPCLIVRTELQCRVGS
jgi:hypothetical protein